MNLYKKKVTQRTPPQTTVQILSFKEILLYSFYVF